MANRYVWSGASGAGTGVDFTNAYTTLAAAITASTAGDVFLLASDHDEAPLAATTHTFKGTAAAPDAIESVNRGTGAYQRGAKIGTGSGAYNYTLAGNFTMRGVDIYGGRGGTSASSITMGTIGARQIYTDGTVNMSNLANTSTRVSITAYSEVVWDNVQVNAATTSNSLAGNPSLLWKNTANPFPAQVPQYLITNSGHGVDITLDSLDLSGFGATKQLVQFTNGLNHRVIIKNCKVSASVVTGTPQSRGAMVELTNCTDGSGNAVNRRVMYEGVASTSTAISRTGGATTGATPFCYALATSAGVTRRMPLASYEVDVPLDAGVATTLTLHTVTDNVTLTNNDCWLEVEYPADANSLDLTMVSTAGDPLVAGTSLTTDTAAWTGVGGTPVKQKASVTVTPATSGLVRARVMVGKPSVTVYACPDILT